MSTERHVCSLEMSRRLAAAGFPQECAFAWWEQEGHTYPGESDLTRIARGAEHLCAAPMLSEIMEQMPPGTEARAWRMLDGPLAWSALARFDSPGTIVEVHRGGPTGPDAAGALWLALRGEK